jgi:hypothetical protein
MSDIQLYKDFDIFSRALIATNDVDPTYPFIKDYIQVTKTREYIEIDPVWFTFVYVAFYNLESAFKVCEIIPDKFTWDNGGRATFIKLREGGVITKFGHERRGTGRRLQTQLDILDDLSLSMEEAKVMFKMPREILKQQIKDNIRWHGEWSLFKILEILEKSFDFHNCAVPDLGLEGRDLNSSDGPSGGLRWLYGRDNVYDKSFINIWNDFGYRLAEHYNVDIGVIETCFCKFHKLKTGKYFISHDILEFHDLQKALGQDRYFDIITNNFDWDLLNGFNHKEFLYHKRMYKEMGTIYLKDYADQLPEADIISLML